MRPLTLFERWYAHNKLFFFYQITWLKFSDVSLFYFFFLFCNVGVFNNKHVSKEIFEIGADRGVKLANI